MQLVETMTQRILFWLSLDTQMWALAERLLQGFAVTGGDLPASAAHHDAEPGGFFRAIARSHPHRSERVLFVCSTAAPKVVK